MRKCLGALVAFVVSILSFAVLQALIPLDGLVLLPDPSPDAEGRLIYTTDANWPWLHSGVMCLWGLHFIGLGKGLELIFHKRRPCEKAADPLDSFEVLS